MGGREVLRFSVTVINKHNQTESGIFSPCMISLLLKDLLFQDMI